MQQPIRVFEHDILKVGDRGFSAAHFDGLVRFNQKHGDRYFTVRHHALRFNSFVGALRVGKLTIEILPKADRSSRPEQAMWRMALVEMLKVCGYLRLESAGQAHLHLRHASLFDLYLESFLHEAAGILRQGLVKRYGVWQENLSALKGRLLVSRHISRNLVHRERFLVEHQRYDRDNQYNRIIKSALQVVMGCATADRLRRQAKRLLIDVEDVREITATEHTFTRLVYARNTERYRPAISLARLILLNYQPDLRSGKTEVLALLFDMNALFEEYIFRQLAVAVRQEPSFAGRISAQRAYSFWRSSDRRRRLRPDILVQMINGSSLVVDTKWKIPLQAYPDDADLRQIHAYNIRTGAKGGWLVYPRVRDSKKEVWGEFEYADKPHGCGMWFVDLLRDGKLNRDLGTEMLRRLTGFRMS